MRVDEAPSWGRAWIRIPERSKRTLLNRTLRYHDAFGVLGEPADPLVQRLRETGASAAETLGGVLASCRLVSLKRPLAPKLGVVRAKRTISQRSPLSDLCN